MKDSILFKFLMLVSPIILLIFIGSKLDKNSSNISSLNDVKNLNYCNNLSYENSLLLHPRNFASKINLHIKFDSEKSWKRNLMNNLVKSEQNKKDSDGWRNFSSKSKRLSGYVSLDMPNHFKCKIKARIREHGDLLDQRDGTLLPSLNIHLTDGHIFGITKFILFLPQARNGANEIFASELFRSVGILSPKSMFVNVKYGRNVKKFIFQEKIQKELLESNNLREAPILEGDERFVFWDKRHKQNLSKNKIVNINWSKKNSSAFKISEYSISILNHLVQAHDTEKYLTDNLDYHTLESKILSKGLFKDLDIFDSFSIAMGSDHVMPRNERRFYFDPLFKEFSPIYYDGMYQIIEKINPYIENNDMIIPSAKTGAEKAIKRLDSIDLNNFYKNLNRSGYEISLEQTKNKINTIKNNLLKIKDFNNDKIFKIKVNKERNPFVEKNENYDEKIKRGLVFYADSFSKYQKCDIFGKQCKNLNLDIKDKLKLLNQELNDKIDGKLIYVGKKRLGSPNENWIYNNYFQDNKVISLEDGVKINIFGNPLVKINKDQRTINITKINQKDRIVFNSGNIKNWKIEMEDSTDIKKLKSFGLDENNLTGCLNFYDTKVNNLDLIFKNSKCEDAINFVRVNGSINSLNIKNSSFDGVDADFSNLEFKKVDVRKSSNDCLDFSFGNYKINEALLEICGDKGISVGEVSNVKILNTQIINSKSGVASKDFSKVKIEDSKISNTEICFEAFNKKPEFSGGLIESIRNICKFNFKFASVGNSSKILLNGKDFLKSDWSNVKTGVGEYNGI